MNLTTELRKVESEIRRNVGEAQHYLHVIENGMDRLTCEQIRALVKQAREALAKVTE